MSLTLAGDRGSRLFLSRSAWALLLIVTILSAAAPTASAKDKKASKSKEYALIFGTVWDLQGRPVGGVPVKIRRESDKKAKWALISDARGEFAQRVPAGRADYVVWADLKGPKDSPKIETKVHIENDERVDIGLHLTR